MNRYEVTMDFSIYQDISAKDEDEALKKVESMYFNNSILQLCPKDFTYTVDKLEDE